MSSYVLLFVHVCIFVCRYQIVMVELAPGRIGPSALRDVRQTELGPEQESVMTPLPRELAQGVHMI